MQLIVKYIKFRSIENKYLSEGIRVISNIQSVWRLGATVVAVGFFLTLTACGGGGGGSSDNKGQPADANPYVITNESANLTKKGQFKSVDGYLSRSKQLLVSEAAGASATYSIPVTQPGYYKTYLWGSHVDEPSLESATVTVRHRDGQTQFSVDQNKRLGQWSLLGVYPFDPAGKNEITLVANSGSSLTLDALRFEFMSTQVPPLQFEIHSIPGAEDAILRLPTAEIGSAYTETVSVLGGSQPYRYNISEGALPSGFTLNMDTGHITGTPSTEQTSDFTLVVSDAAGAQISTDLSIQINKKVTVSSPIQNVAEGKAQPADGNPSGAPPDMSALINILKTTPEGSWVKVNLNPFSDVWSPSDLRPLVGAANPSPSRIISAWSSFAWDPNRGDLWLFGGGHANYSGNDVYRWRGTTRMWERASLPSEMMQDDLGTWKAVDGQDKAPSSAHTYDNNMFLPVSDRLLVFGGAAYNNGSNYVRQISPTASRRTGPYMFNPALADGNKVGGSTGSHVKRVSPRPEVLGGDMWFNRDIYVNIPPASIGPLGLPTGHVSGCTAYNTEGGKDVVYVAARFNGGSQLSLARYTINNVNDPTQDTWKIVGGYRITVSDNQPTCAYDPVGKVFVKRQDNTTLFDYWSLNGTLDGSNSQVKFTPVDPTGEFATLISTNALRLFYCGMDFDPIRRKYGLWCGDGRTWMITPPTVLGPTGWTINKQVAPTGAVPPANDGQGGVIGKWKYIPNIDAFIGLTNINEGQVWIYKPVGWTLGGDPQPPTETIVDNAGQGIQDAAGGRSFTGSWCTSAGATPYGASSLYSCGEGSNSYRWTPNITAAGSYDVYVRWTTFANRSSTVPISVTTGGTTVTKIYDQKTGGGTWVLHDRYTFAQGTAGYVEVDDSNGQANADAIRLVPVP